MTNEILMNLFIPNTPLHDGAVIIRETELLLQDAFALTQSQNLSKELGTRHRAAIGITEISDSMVIIVSEESGVISFAKMGRLSRYLDTKSLREIVKNSIKAKESKQPIWMKWSAKNE